MQNLRNVWACALSKNARATVGPGSVVCTHLRYSECRLLMDAVNSSLMLSLDITNTPSGVVN